MYTEYYKIIGNVIIFSEKVFTNILLLFYILKYSLRRPRSHWAATNDSEKLIKHTAFQWMCLY